MPVVDPLLGALLLAVAGCLAFGPCSLDERSALQVARRELDRLGLETERLALRATRTGRLLGRRYWDVSFRGAGEGDGRVLVSARSGWVIATILGG